MHDRMVRKQKGRLNPIAAKKKVGKLERKESPK